MRLFLAVDLPEEVKTKLYNQLEPLRDEYPEFSWERKENYHINVRFFEDVDDDLVEKLKKKIEGALYDAPSFYLFSLNTAMFINTRILLYLGFQREKKLEELESKISETFQFDPDYKFIPHLTIARYKIPSKQQYFVLKKKLEQQKVDIEFPVTSVSLFQSILSAKTPTYKKIAEFPLQQD